MVPAERVRQPSTSKTDNPLARNTSANQRTATTISLRSRLREELLDEFLQDERVASALV
jgi:hypothetical protein